MGDEKKQPKKRFPATINLNELTFLNDKKINGELYAYLQSVSEVNDLGDNNYETFIEKKRMPNQSLHVPTHSLREGSTYKQSITLIVYPQVAQVIMRPLC